MLRNWMMSILIIGVLGLFAAACNDNGGDPTTVLRKDESVAQRPPILGCIVDEDDLEVEWAEYSSLETSYFIQESFTVTRGQYFFETRPATGYPSFGTHSIGLAVPANAFPIGAGDPEITITVAIPAYNSSYTNDKRVNVRIWTDLPAETPLNHGIEVILPRFPWYDTGETLNFYYLTESDDVPPEYSFRNLRCVDLGMGLESIIFGIDFIPSECDTIGGGDGGWSTNSGGSSNGSG